MGNSSIINILQDFNEDDPHALDEFVRRFSAELGQIAYIILLPLDHDSITVIKNVVLKAQIHALRSHGNFRDETHLRMWLIRKTIRLCKRELQVWRLKQTFFKIFIKSKRKQVAETNFPTEQLNRLNLALRNLNDNQRIAIVLRYVCGFQAEDIGLTLSRSERTILTRLFTAREKLDVILE